MDILTYLIALLQAQKEVGLPGLGTFYKTKNPGRYDAGTHSYFPPSYILNFKEAVTEQDLLAQHISDVRRISSESAHYFIAQYVHKIMQALDTHAAIELHNLGTIRKQDGALSFEPHLDVDLGADFFGYPPVKELDLTPDEVEESAPLPEETVAPVEEEVLPEAGEDNDVTAIPATEVPEIELTNVAATSDENELAAPADVQEQPTEKFDADIETEADPEEDSNGWPTTTKWLAFIFLLVLVAAAVYWFKPELYNDLFKIQTAGTTQTLTLPDKNNLKSNPDTLQSDTTFNNKVLAALNGDSADTVQVSGPTYEIIAAAVKTEQETKRLIDRYNKIGFQGKIIPGKILKKISVATFTSEKEARDSLNAVRKKLHNQEIYIFYNNPK